MKIGLVLLIIILTSFSVSAQILRVDMIKQDPDPVRAGDVVKVTFKLENLWDETQNDVRVELLPEYPLSLYESSNVKNLGRVESRRTYDAVYFDYKLKVDADATKGDHELKMNLHVGDMTYKPDTIFFVDVDADKISLKPYISASDLVVSGRSGKFTIEIANTGGEDVEALELELLPSEGYKLLSTSSYIYVGNLESDDTESVDYNIYVPENVQVVKIPINLKYMVNDKDYEKDFELGINLLTMEEAKQVGLLKVSYTSYYVLGVVVLILLLLALRRIFKR